MFKLDLDYTVENVNLIVIRSQILKALKYFAEGGEFVLVEAKSLDIIFKERGFLGELRFSKDKLKKALEPYLSYFTMLPSFFNES